MLHVNKNEQKLLYKTKDKPRNHPKATVDILECLKCGYVYAVVSCVTHCRRCPKCQGGRM
jgi:predicted Zn-ribbon and HTH transcriptional regulator